MAETVVQCTRCNVPMQVGWYAEIGKGTRPLRWVEGKPESSVWTSYKAPKDKTHDVVTHRCPGCGLLESYANPPG